MGRRVKERDARSLYMRPEREAVYDEELTPEAARAFFEKRCRQPGTRCNEIMTAILNGETDAAIAKRYDNGEKEPCAAYDITVYRMQLARVTGLVPEPVPITPGLDVIPTGIDEDETKRPVHMPRVLTMAMLKHGVELVNSGVRCCDLVYRLGVPLWVADQIGNYARKGEFYAHTNKARSERRAKRRERIAARGK